MQGYGTCGLLSPLLRGEELLGLVLNVGQVGDLSVFLRPRKVLRVNKEQSV